MTTFLVGAGIVIGGIGHISRIGNISIIGDVGATYKTYFTYTAYITCFLFPRQAPFFVWLAARPIKKAAM